ncbi:hypothetical protein NDU88_001641 [Pleurodeles waltl]|uniref:Uncharacterized protein n=1 Tax=Pleurodeles waltl TaxID=8319 RepID=A0AAV7LD74_PLEWA|nr:hypothetical protein NDU88_001641 [Pleurodeles waltl]
MLCQASVLTAPGRTKSEEVRLWPQKLTPLAAQDETAGPLSQGAVHREVHFPALWVPLQHPCTRSLHQQAKGDGAMGSRSTDRASEAVSALIRALCFLPLVKRSMEAHLLQGTPFIRQAVILQGAHQTPACGSKPCLASTSTAPRPN